MTIEKSQPSDKRRERIAEWVSRCTCGLDAAALAPSPVRSGTPVKLQLQPVTLAEANAFIREHHRHHLPPQGWKFGIAANDGARVVGVVTVGRPVGRHQDDGYTLEVTRCCTDGTSNSASMLYGAAWRAARALGYRRMITYTLASEAGTSVKAAGWREVGAVKGRSWHCESRPRVDKHPTEDKTMWSPI